jgi:hypothetical protein
MYVGDIKNAGAAPKLGAKKKNVRTRPSAIGMEATAGANTSKKGAGSTVSTIHTNTCTHLPFSATPCSLLTSLSSLACVHMVCAGVGVDGRGPCFRGANRGSTGPFGCGGDRDLLGDVRERVEVRPCDTLTLSLFVSCLFASLPLCLFASLPLRLFVPLPLASAPLASLRLCLFASCFCTSYQHLNSLPGTHKHTLSLIT